MTTLLYLVKDGEDNAELRYSLRSVAANLPHDRVVFVGHKPAWVTGVELIPGNRHPSKWDNVFDNLRIAARALDEFVVMNDDIFIMEPMTVAPSWNRGLLVDHMRKVRTGPWRASLEATLAYLRSQGIGQPVSYEIHTPVTMRGDMLEAVLAPHADAPVAPQWRTLYGNVYGIESTQVRDTKITRTVMKFDHDRPVLSTDDPTFRYCDVGRFIRGSFPKPSPYEVSLTAAVVGP